MFHNKREIVDDKLKKQLKDAWPLHTAKERETFMQRLKLVIPPDHPGLLFLSGRIKRHTANGYDHNGDARWRRRGIVGFAWAWSVIILVILLTVFGLQRWYWSVPVAPNTSHADDYGIITDNTSGASETMSTERYIYQFNGYKIVDSRKFSLAKATEEINKLKPMGMEVVVTGMKEVNDYYEDSNGVTYHYTVYELEARPKTESEKQEEGFKSPP